MADGRLGKCKDCTKIDVAANRYKNHEYYLEFDRKRFQNDPKRRAYIVESAMERAKLDPLKTKARSMVNKRVQTGTIVKPEVCEECESGGTRLEGHHEDYSKPLDVEWLCTICHGKRHRTTYPEGSVQSF